MRLAGVIFSYRGICRNIKTDNPKLLLCGGFGLFQYMLSVRVPFTVPDKQIYFSFMFADKGSDMRTC